MGSRGRGEGLVWHAPSPWLCPSLSTQGLRYGGGGRGVQGGGRRLHLCLSAVLLHTGTPGLNDHEIIVLVPSDPKQTNFQ